MRHSFLVGTLTLTTFIGLASLTGCAGPSNDDGRASSDDEITAPEYDSLVESGIAAAEDDEYDLGAGTVAANDDDGAQESTLPPLETASDGTETEDVDGEDADDEAPARAMLLNGAASASATSAAATPSIGITEQRTDRIMVFPATEHTWTNRIPSWSWGPNNATTGTGKNVKFQIPKNLWGRFENPSDIKFKKNGTVLLAASGGAAAIVRMADRKITFVAYPGGNPHAIETLPGNQIVTASSKGYLCVFSTKKGTDRTCEKTSFPLAHGLVWDGARKRLWVVGGTQLGSYSLSGSKLKLDKAYSIPGNGHDLSPDGKDTLLISSTHNVYSFNRATHKYRVLPNIDPHNYVKGIDRHPGTQELLVSRDHNPKDEVYGDDVVGHFTPAGIHDAYTRKGAQIYKARWVVGR